MGFDYGFAEKKMIKLFNQASYRSEILFCFREEKFASGKDKLRALLIKSTNDFSPVLPGYDKHE